MLYLSLSSLETETRLRILRLINESVGRSGKTAVQLVEEARRENEGQIKPRARLSDIRGSQTVSKQDWVKVRRAIRASELVTQKKLEKMCHD